MNNNLANYFAGRVFGELQNWLGFRQGRESITMETLADTETLRHQAQTDKFSAWLENAPPDEPRDLAITAACILAELRGLTLRAYWRNLMEALRDPYADVPRLEARLAALAGATGKRRRQESECQVW